MGVSSRAHFSALARLAYTCAGTRGLTVGTYALVVVWCERKQGKRDILKALQKQVVVGVSFEGRKGYMRALGPS